MENNKDLEKNIEEKKPIFTFKQETDKTNQVQTSDDDSKIESKESKESKESSDSKDQKDNKAELVTKNRLLEYGVHYGHQKQWRNPKMIPFIQYTKNGTHIINLHKTIASLQNAYKAIYKLTEAKKSILFVGTTKQSSLTTKLNAERVGSLYINNRWLGGLLTNFKTIKNSINKLKKLEKQAEQNFEGYTKKEGILLQKELDKLNANLGGIKNIRKLPDAIFVSSVKNDIIVIQEAKKLGIPVIGIVDTNVDPSLVEFPIPANDDSLKSESLIITILADAIAEAQSKPLLVAYKENDIKVLGLDENFVKKPSEKPYGNYKSFNRDRNFNRDGNSNFNKDRNFNRDGNSSNNNFNKDRNFNKDGNNNNNNFNKDRNFNRDGNSSNNNFNKDRNFNRDNNNNNSNFNKDRNFKNNQENSNIKEKNNNQEEVKNNG